MERIIDQAWASLLANVMKKREVLRPQIGDQVDLYLPQSRLLSLLQSNPAIARLLYSSAQASARRNAVGIVKKLGMPADYFWKFEYWPKGRAFTTLEKLVARVFSSMMAQAKEGNLEITELDIEPLRISLNFKDCVECAGIAGLEHGICYYHAGALSGILSGLIGRDFDGFETDCYARGSQSCRFTVGDRGDEDVKTKHDAYLSAPEVKADLAERLKTSLNNLPARAMGNLVDVSYHQLVMANLLVADPPRLAAASLDTGSQLGHRLAPVLAGFYGKEGLQDVGDYYLRLGELRIEVKGDKPQLELVIRECAECIGNAKVMEMMSFLFGELQALVSELTKTEMVLKESRFEGDNLLLTFAAKN